MNKDVTVKLNGLAALASGKLKRPRKRRHSIVSISSFLDEYTTILQGSTSSTIEECCKSLGVGKTQFYERRWVVELFIVNGRQFEQTSFSQGLMRVR